MGLATGFILLIPFIQYFACFSFILIGAGTVFYLKKNSFVGILSLQDGALIGAIAGFIGLIASAIVYLPISWLKNLIFNPIAQSGFHSSFSFMTTSFSFIVAIMLIFFVALMSALFNSFSGLVAAYVYEKIENLSIKDEGGFVIEKIE